MAEHGYAPNDALRFSPGIDRVGLFIGSDLIFNSTQLSQEKAIVIQAKKSHKKVQNAP